LVGKDKDSCCKEKDIYDINLGAPIIRKLVSSAEGLVTVTFDQAMLFDKEWVKETNDVKTTNKPRLEVIYKNGFIGTTDFYKNRMTSWEVVSANNTQLEI
jgi:hypothetical protein